MEIDESDMNKSSSSRRLDFTNMENDDQPYNHHISIEEKPQIGKEFDNEEDAYQFYLAYARKTDNEKYEVFEFISQHTHQLTSPQKTHFFLSHRRIDEVHAAQIEIAEHVGLAPKLSHNLMVKEAGSRDNLGFARQDIKNYLRSKRTKYMKVGDTGGVLEYLQGMQSRDSNFSYSIQVDEDGMIKNIFWADGRMRADYIDFGDVVSFDTTYRKIRENCPLALFVGVNHHKQTVVFGAALLYDETIPSFQWLFDAFASTMYGRKLTTILTDQDQAMANALASRWPDTHHRCICDFDEEDEFLHEWNKMLVQYNLMENAW
ncbi:protein FAR1-RELATED SEQUENCE 5-like [Andrographis paniculata]|uniref:protein FAR1-RELATED SEQUENCE 5-like n=1 Tax=Andrographis paniculata TaxID=175694 RepID=UPI0021E89C5C|nr:protein FAR1-RELATED SEQUENCE 5-like [Andrographis paniculata]